MITIPLSDVVAFLTRRGVDLACLEGAPFVVAVGAYVGRLRAFDGGDTHPDTALYLGSGPVCPAAVGWATSMLAAARSTHIDMIEVSSDAVRGYVAGDGFANAALTWRWDPTQSELHEPRRTWWRSAAPITPAGRLHAVLLHEMERA